MSDIGALCRKDPVTVREFDELTVAAQLMREHHVGYLVVVEPNLVLDTLATEITAVSGSIRNELRVETALRR